MSRDFFARKPTARGSFGGVLRVLEDTGAAGFSMEELIDGVQRTEPELCFVGRITDSSILQRATRVERQEERCLFLTPKGDADMARLRIRRSTVKDHVDDVLTFKCRKANEQYSKESSVKAPDGLFELFSTLPGVRCNEKTRYVFSMGEPYTQYGEFWEVDVFPDGEGGHSAWCKLDYEIKHDSSLKLKLPDFPEGIADIISAKPATKEQRAFVQQLFNTVFFRNQ